MTSADEPSAAPRAGVDIEVEAAARPVLPRTLPALLAEGAECRATTAFTYLDYSAGATVPVEERVSFATLHRRARAVAAVLTGRFAPDTRLLLLYPPGPRFLEVLLGCALAGMVAVPAYPLGPSSPERTTLRLGAIVHDAGVAATLTTAAVRDRLAAGPALPEIEWTEVISTDGIPDETGLGWPEPVHDPDHVWLIQYTSGSVSAPKGVLLTHANVLADLEMFIDQVGRRADDVFVTWLPHQHDMGLVGGLLLPLAMGIPCVSMSPQAFLRRPLRWLEVITRYRATLSPGPNFSFDLCVRRATDQDIERADLSRLRVLWNASEPIAADTIDRFTAKFAPAGFDSRAFCPCYGLAEATLMVSGAVAGRGPTVGWFDRAALEKHVVAPVPAAAPEGRRLVSSGLVRRPGRVLIIDPDTSAASPDGRVGEIWVAGPHVSRGYHGNPEETARTFDGRTSAGEGPFLRTGDLGFLHDGELFVAGRVKDLIILYGRNHHPQDIERTVQSVDPGLRPGCGAAFGLDDDGVERLVLIQELDPERSALPAAPLVAAIRSAVAREHSIQADAIRIVPRGAVLRTTSGKVRRRATARESTSGRLPVLASWDPTTGVRVFDPTTGRPVVGGPAVWEIEAFLVSEVVRLTRIRPERIDRAVSLVENGLDSLYLLELVEATECWLGRASPEPPEWQTGSIRDLARRLSRVREPA